MVKRVFDYRQKRTVHGAIAFYGIHLALVLLFGLLASSLIFLITGNTSERFLFQVASGIATLSCLFISFSVIEKKNLLHNRRAFVIAISAGFLALLGGSMLGLLPSAYLSTLEADKKA